MDNLMDMMKRLNLGVKVIEPDAIFRFVVTRNKYLVLHINEMYLLYNHNNEQITFKSDDKDVFVEWVMEWGKNKKYKNKK